MTDREQLADLLYSCYSIDQLERCRVETYHYDGLAANFGLDDVAFKLAVDDALKRKTAADEHEWQKYNEPQTERAALGGVLLNCLEMQNLYDTARSHNLSVNEYVRKQLEPALYLDDLKRD